jgi:extracellular factor (EF) 3-hydroxypalmitic acid methyl ester biosynthesis protein
MSYAALDIFQQLRQEDIHWMLASAELRTISANGVLVREDDPSETIFFIADGLFEVYVYGGSGRLKVGQLGPGEIIGEISWLDRKPISATVRAVETSSVLTLSIAALEHKIAADAGFAARLFRAIATLTAERLRTTTSQVRRAEVGVQSASPAEGATAAVLLSKIDELKRLVAAQEAGTGPVPDQFAGQIREAFATVEQGTHPEGLQNADKLADRLQTELLPLVRLSATGERCFAQPRGYAGDYQTIDMVNSNKPAGTGRVGPVVDSCLLNLAAAKAIRNRRRLLASEILASYAATQKEFHVACLACGPASEIFDAFEKAADKGRLQVSCIDIDREALAHVTARAQAEKLGDQLQTFHGNLIYLATGRQELDLAPQDLVYSLNLTDYFSDELAVTLIDWIYDALRPSGRAILGNFHPKNPSRGLMDHLLDWRLTYRDEAAMNQLFLASKFAKPCSRILFEDDGIYLLAECAK